MRVITPLSQKSSNTKQNHTASTPKFQSTLSPLKNTLNFQQNHRTAKQKSPNFSTQYDNLL
jgi:hypothetical protein